MRRHFFGSTFRRAFSNKLDDWPSDSIKLVSSFVLGTRTFFQEHSFHTEGGSNGESSVDANPFAVTKEDHAPIGGSNGKSSVDFNPFAATKEDHAPIGGSNGKSSVDFNPFTATKGGSNGKSSVDFNPFGATKKDHAPIGGSNGKSSVDFNPFDATKKDHAPIGGSNGWRVGFNPFAAIKRRLSSDGANPFAETKEDPAPKICDEELAYLTSMSLIDLRQQFSRDSALAGRDDLIAGLALMKYYEYKRSTLQKVLNGFQSTFQKVQLEKDPHNREKLPWALPIAEIECVRIADLKIEEDVIVFVESFFFGEEGQNTGTSSHSVFITCNKGVPFRAVIGRNVKGCKTEAGPYALERSLFYANKFCSNSKCRFFSSDKDAVKCVQERMKKLKAGEKVSDDRYTRMAKFLIKNGSTIEFMAKEDNLIAAFFAHVIGKLGDLYLHRLDDEDEDEPFDEKHLAF